MIGPREMRLQSGKIITAYSRRLSYRLARASEISRGVVKMPLHDGTMLNTPVGETQNEVRILKTLYDRNDTRKQFVNS